MSKEKDAVKRLTRDESAEKADRIEALKRELRGYELYGNKERAAQVRKLLDEAEGAPKRGASRRETASSKPQETR